MISQTPNTDVSVASFRPFNGISLFRWGGILLVTAFALVYALTIDTGLQPYELHGGDLITHQYAQVQARPSNAPGYPIYTMGGWLWFHGWHSLLSSFGQTYPNPIPILSTYSVLWALVALWLLYAVLGELLGKERERWQSVVFCLLVTSFFGVTYFFWYYATTTEQYSSAVAQTLAILYLYLLWDKEPERRSRLYWLAFLCGLSLAHMLTVALIVPPLVIVVLWRDPSLLRSPRAIAFSILAAALPLLSYGYVYVRGALHPSWWGSGYWETPQEWFWAFVSTAQGRDELAWAFEPGRPFFGNGFPELIWQELSLPILVLGVVGVAFLPRRTAVLLYATLVLYLIFCWFYRFGNWFQVIMPAYPLLLVGLAPLYALCKGNYRYLPIAAMLFALLVRANQSLPAANSRHRLEDTALTRASLLLDQNLPQDARLFAAVDDALAINYINDIWGIRPDIKTINSHDANDDVSEGGKVYATIDALPTLLNEVSITSTVDSFSPDWIEVRSYESVSQELLPNTAIYTVTPTLLLVDSITHSAPTGGPLLAPGDPALDVRLTWLLSDGTWPEGLRISLRPTFKGQVQVDPATGQPIQQDRDRPVDGFWRDLPTQDPSTIPTVVHDAYRLSQPLSLEAPADGLLLILYRQTEEGFANVAEIPLPLKHP